MTPLFDPGPIEHPDIPIHLAAVNTHMCQVAGEFADGVRPHPICSDEYIANVMIPEVRKGAAKAGRSLESFRHLPRPLIATAANAAECHARQRRAGAPRLLCLEPAYRPPSSTTGLATWRVSSANSPGRRTGRRCRATSPTTFSTSTRSSAPTTRSPSGCARFGGIITNCEFSIAMKSNADKAKLARIVERVHADPLDAVRQRLCVGNA